MSTQIERVGGDLIVSRVFDTSRETMFAVWTEAERVQEWWGCGATESVKSTVEPRVGGVFRHEMFGEAYGRMVMLARFTEVEPPARLAYVMEADPNEAHSPFAGCEVMVDFTEVDGGTEVRVVMKGLPEIPDMDIGEIVSGGYRASFDKLARHVAK